MKDWFSEWEESLLTGTGFEEKLSLDEEDRPVPRCRNTRSERPVAWVRKHRYKYKRLARFYRSFNGLYSESLWHYYLPDASKPTKICRLEGHGERLPSRNKKQKRHTNRRIRRNNLMDTPLKGTYMMKLCSYPIFD